MDAVVPFFEEHYEAIPIINGQEFKQVPPVDLVSPVDKKRLGILYPTDEDALDNCINQLKHSKFQFDDLENLTTCVDRIADELHKHRFELIFLCM